MQTVLGVDIGTSSSKGVLASLDGRVIATAVREHEVSRPQPGWAEMDARVWWDEFISICHELVTTETEVVAVGLSGMGPCVLVTDGRGEPLRPAILYGIDSRATQQIALLTDQLGGQEVLDRCGSALSTQAVGPKLAWLRDNEPTVFSATRRLFMPNSWLAWNLTGEYVLDHHSASQCTPMYETDEHRWYSPWCELIAPDIELPPLVWADAVVGNVTADAAARTGLPIGVPVISGTIDAWTEAVSVGAQEPGDLMLMYGTTMFLINTVSERITVPELWGTVGAFAGTRCLAGGMATSGAITAWLRRLLGNFTYPELLQQAADAGAGAHGLLLLPYFAGERTPIADPDARGFIAGLTVEHEAGDLYRAALEATAFGVRHNIDAIRAAGGRIDRIVVAGGGTQGDLWPQIVSDVTGVPQVVPEVTVGASYGAAFLAARAIEPRNIADWNPAERVIQPRRELAETYDELFELYLALYRSTVDIAHSLARRQRSAALTDGRRTSSTLDDATPSVVGGAS